MESSGEGENERMMMMMMLKGSFCAHNDVFTRIIMYDLWDLVVEDVLLACNP